MITKNDLRELREFHGKEEITTICMEECAELIQAISKMKRHSLHDPYPKHLANLVEEMADVSIVIKTLQGVYGITDKELDNEIERKHRRNLERIKND